MGNAAGVKDKTLRRFAAAAVLEIPVDEMVASSWKDMSPMIYENEDETIIPRFKAVKKLLRRKQSYTAILEFVGTGEALEAVESTTEAPAKPAPSTSRRNGNAKNSADKSDADKSDADRIKDAMNKQNK